MISAVIDRFEEDKAILLIGDEEEKVIFPKALLDKNLKEGDYVSIAITYDAIATKEAVEEAKRLLASLKEKTK